MFSKKVEEFDELKQTLSLKEIDFNSLSGETLDLKDFHDKYQREYSSREDLSQKYTIMNELLE